MSSLAYELSKWNTDILGPTVWFLGPDPSGLLALVSKDLGSPVRTNSSLYYPRLKTTSVSNRRWVKTAKSILKLECYTAVKKRKEAIDRTQSPQHSKKSQVWNSVCNILPMVWKQRRAWLSACPRDSQGSCCDNGLWEGKLRAWRTWVEAIYSSL